ncbi:hypothetical protein PI172_0037 [Prevotella intermedia]|uniref:Uncharacterized protein n=1 Tax=Prevotella intermedia TaxID=28131 RepID=A0AAD1BG85_PREIN|nr:hypothetical protein PI172_0037 [Prevotella intermedia]
MAATVLEELLTQQQSYLVFYCVGRNALLRNKFTKLLSVTKIVKA